MLTASSTDGPAFHTRSHIQNSSGTTSVPHSDTTPQISQGFTTTPKPLTAECLDALLQMQKLTHSASTFPEDYCMAKHLTMNLKLSLMSKDFCTNI